MFWGAAHALSPGHGKSIVAAYLVGSRGTPRHAVFLGLTVTVTHTIGVFALGLVTLSLSAFIVPDQLYPWLNLVSALLIVGVGVSVLRWRVREWRQREPRATPPSSPPRPRPRARARPRAQRSAPARDRRLGRDHPVPDRAVVLLAAISLHRVGYGLVLILAFSVGLAARDDRDRLCSPSRAKRPSDRVDFDGGARSASSPRSARSSSSASAWR